MVAMWRWFSDGFPRCGQCNGRERNQKMSLKIKRVHWLGRGYKRTFIGKYYGFMLKFVLRKVLSALATWCEAVQMLGWRRKIDDLNGRIFYSEADHRDLKTFIRGMHDLVFRRGRRCNE